MLYIPRKLKRAVIKEEFLLLTNSVYEAVILNQFLYWTERTRDFDQFIQEEKDRMSAHNMELNIEQSNGWIYKKAEELAEETLLNASPQTIRRHLNNLINKQYLFQRRNPKYRWDKTLQYRVNFTKLIVELNKLGYPLDGYEKFNYSNLQNGGSEIQNGDSQLQNGVAIPEITSEITSNSSSKKRTLENGESDGTLQPADKGDHSDLDTEGKVSHTPEQFALALEKRFIQLRGKGLQVSAKDLKAIYEVIKSGVELEDALRWLEETFANYKPEYPGQHINAFEYCKQRILHQAYLKQERLKAAQNPKRGDSYEERATRTSGFGKDASGISAETKRLEEIARKQGLVSGEIRDTDFNF